MTKGHPTVGFRPGRNSSVVLSEFRVIVNPDKTKFFVMGDPKLLRRLPPLSVTFLGKEISPVSVAKDLGVFY